MYRKVVLILWGMFLGVGIQLNAQSYQSVKGKIMTSWAEQVSPEKFWQLYMNMADYMDEKN